MSLIDPFLSRIAPSPPRHLRPFVLPGPTLAEGLEELRERLLRAGEDQ
jgi:hypothetical protein